MAGGCRVLQRRVTYSLVIRDLQLKSAIVAGSVPYRSSLLAIMAHPAASQPVQLHDHAVPSLLRTEIEPTVALRVLSARVVAVSGAACALITECEYATMHVMHTRTASKCIGASEEVSKYLRRRECCSKHVE